MPKAVRGTLLIIAAVLGVLQISILIGYFRIGSFAYEGTPVAFKISWLLLLPTAVVGLIAALPIGSVSRSRLFAAIAAGLSLLSYLILPIYYVFKNISSGYDPGDVFEYFIDNLVYVFFVWSKDFFLYPWHQWIEMMGLIALILWIICAAFPAKKGSEVSLGAPTFGDHNAMPSTPVTGYAPSPMNPAPVVPATTQGAKFCINCGKPLVGTAKFCAECGTPREN